MAAEIAEFCCGSNEYQTSWLLSPVDVRSVYCIEKAGFGMFLILAIVLVVLWLGGFLVFKGAGLLIHLLLLFAIISLIMHFVSGKRAG
jgi:hypothetical protein